MSDLSPRTSADSAASLARVSRPGIASVLLIVVVVIGGLIVTQFLRSAVDYYCNADEVGVVDGCGTDRRLRVQGMVDAGSVEAAATETRFTISFNDVAIPVVYPGEPGGIFAACIPVVVHGAFDGDVFVGDRVEVKHSEDYVAANNDRLDATSTDAANCESASD